MTIYFICKTNNHVPYINTAKFLTKTGMITVDRDETEYDYDGESGQLEMTWKHVYIWDGNNKDYDSAEDLAENAIFAELEIEDDAPEDYEIECVECHLYDPKKFIAYSWDECERELRKENPEFWRKVDYMAEKMAKYDGMTKILDNAEEIDFFEDLSWLTKLWIDIQAWIFIKWDHFTNWIYKKVHHV